MSDLLLFLGAGISTPLNVPTMTEMVESFEKSLGRQADVASVGPRTVVPSKRLEKLLYDEIKRGLLHEYGRYDIESVLIVLQSLKSDSFTGAYEAFLLDQMGKERSDIVTVTRKKSAVNLERSLISYILEQCKLDITVYEANRNYYDLLFNFIGNIDNTLKSDKRLGICTYTTNYDRYLDRYLLDRFSNNYTQAVQDYYSTSGSDGRLSIEPDYHFIKSWTPSNEYVKLHGSVDWYLDKSERVMRTLEPLSETQKRRVMLYPTTEKPYYLEPWVRLMMLFRKALERIDHWLVIGYSFNDDYLRAIFEEALNLPRKRLLVISRNGREIVKRHFSDRKNVRGLNCEVKKINRCLDYAQEWFKV